MHNWRKNHVGIQLQDVLVCIITLYCYWLFVFWLILWVHQNMAQLIKIYTEILHTKTSNKGYLFQVVTKFQSPAKFTGWERGDCQLNFVGRYSVKGTKPFSVMHVQSLGIWTLSKPSKQKKFGINTWPSWVLVRL